MTDQPAVERRILPQIGLFLAAVILFLSADLVTWAHQASGISRNSLISVVQLNYMLSPLIAAVVLILFCATPIKITTPARRMLRASRVALTTLAIPVFVIAFLVWFTKLMDALLLAGC